MAATTPSPSPSPGAVAGVAHFGFFEIFSVALTGLYAFVHNYGLAIILLTVIVRLILLPLSVKQIKSMREMQKIQPEVKKLQAKYKGDRQKLNEEMMKLYKVHGVNPFGGCLPLVAQLPVFIGLFRVLRTPLNYLGYHATTNSAGALTFLKQSASGIMQTVQSSSFATGLFNHAVDLNRFLGIRLDCSAKSTLSTAPDPTLAQQCTHGLAPALPYLVLALLMGLTTYYQQKQMQGRQGAQDPTQQQMQMFGKIMPLFLTALAFTFPAGLVIYWLTTNVWTIGQQQFMFKIAPEATTPGGDGKAGTKGSEKGPSPRGGGRSGSSSGAGGDRSSAKGNGGEKANPSTRRNPAGRPDPNRKKKR
jgi:YidC/Oxa1 family membrane protein insertase